jgi:hypothetical protein
MATLIFLAAIVALLIFSIRVIVKLFKGKAIKSSAKAMGIIIFSYCFAWFVFYFLSTDKPIPFGTYVCFDDWCSTISKVEKPRIIGKENSKFLRGQWIILHIKMSNHARGIAQKPSEPRIHIIDENGNAWSFSKEGQKALESFSGLQPPLDAKLELHQTLETQLVFDVPKDIKKPKVLIEEGPFITEFLFQGDSEVFLLY